MTSPAANGRTIRVGAENHPGAIAVKPFTQVSNDDKLSICSVSGTDVTMQQCRAGFCRRCTSGTSMGIHHAHPTGVMCGGRMRQRRKYVRDMHKHYSAIKTW